MCNTHWLRLQYGELKAAALAIAIYHTLITWSNSKLLSSELMTQLTGRLILLFL